MLTDSCDIVINREIFKDCADLELNRKMINDDLV